MKRRDEIAIEENIFFKDKPMSKNEKMLYSCYVTEIACSKKLLEENKILDKEEWLKIYRKTGCHHPPFKAPKKESAIIRFLKDLVPHISIQ